MGTAWIGFTASTSGGYQNHDILNWAFDSVADDVSSVAIGDAKNLEGLSDETLFEFPVTVARPDATGILTFNVDYATSDDTALSGSDYQQTSGTLAFNLPVGQTTQTLLIQVPVAGDDIVESHEQFQVNVSNSAGVLIVDGTGVGTIINDETTLSIDDATATEGDSSGTLVNGAAFTAGYVEQAFQFDGVDDLMQAPTTSLPTGNDDRTIELWVNADSFPTSGEAFFASYGQFGILDQTYHLGTVGTSSSSRSGETQLSGHR